MSSMSRPRSYSLPSGFGRLLVERFGRTRFLIVGGDRDELQRQLRGAGAETAWFESPKELAAAALIEGTGPRSPVVIWVYPREKAADEASAQALAGAAKSILLIPEPGTEPS